MTNSADPAEVKKNRRKNEEAREQELLDLKGLLEIPEFRSFIFRHISLSGGFFSSSFNPSGSVVYFNEGRRDFALQLVNEIKQAVPAAFAQMQKEHAERE